MASKYKVLEGSYQVYVEDESYQARINEWKTENYGPDVSMTELVARLKAVKAEKRELEAEIKNCNVALKALSQMMTNIIRADDLESVTLDNGSTISLKYKLYPNVTNKAALRVWCEANGLLESLQLPSSTLLGVCNDLALSGQPLPDGVEGYLETKAEVYGISDKGSFRHPPEEGASIGDLLK